MSDLSIRKELLAQRLQEIALPRFQTKPSKRKKIPPLASVTEPIVPTFSRESDTHWDFLLKEMQWLAADFTTERQRHAVARKKLSGAVVAWQRGAARRDEKRYATALARQRKTALRIQRAVTHWWTQLDRVITYQQRCVYETGQRTAMNQQLVRLVQQTEKYTTRTNTQQQQKVGNANDLEVVLQRQERTAIGPRQRRSVDDYVRLEQQMKEQDDASVDTTGSTMLEYYNMNTTTDDEDDDDDYNGSDDPATTSSDDESTLRQAEQEEMRDRMTEGDAAFVADPEELRLLQQEATIPVEELLLAQRHDRAVQFASDEEEEEDDEFVVQASDPMAVDDERTMEAEERMPQEMTASEELALLQQENEMSVEDLRKRYYGADEDVGDEDDEESAEEDDVVMEESDEGSDEFEPDAAAIDDETTMEAEERLGRDMSYADEIELLNQESKMSIEELRAKYAEPAPPSEHPSLPALLGVSVGDEENDEDFRPDIEAEADDETTIEAEERLGREITPEQEIALLEADSKVSIDDIRKLYQENTVDKGSAEDTTTASVQRRRAKRRVSDTEPSRATKRPRNRGNEETAEQQLTISNDVHRTTSRVTRPFLIPSWVRLREYQQDGLSWLVSLQSRRLNGILADEMGLVRFHRT